MRTLDCCPTEQSSVRTNRRTAFRAKLPSSRRPWWLVTQESARGTSPGSRPPGVSHPGGRATGECLRMGVPMVNNCGHSPRSMMLARCVRSSTARSDSTRHSRRSPTWNGAGQGARLSSRCHPQAPPDNPFEPCGAVLSWRRMCRIDWSGHSNQHRLPGDGCRSRGRMLRAPRAIRLRVRHLLARRERFPSLPRAVWRLCANSGKVSAIDALSGRM